MVVAVLAVLGLIAAVYFFHKGAAQNEVHAKFGLSPATYRIVSSDLGDSSPRKRLYGRGVAGEPDALFLDTSKSHMVAGEFKSRKFKGYVRPRELYQLTLYLGLALQQHRPKTITGVLAYADHRVTVEFDVDVFSALIELRPELLSSFSRRSAVNPTPLHKRMNVLAQNRHIRLARD